MSTLAERTVKSYSNTYGNHDSITVEDGGYKSTIGPRNIKTTSLSMVSADQGHLNSPMSVIAHREKEKRELQDLNERFASYIETVRFLEFHNKKLQADIAFFRSKLEKLAGIIKAIYETELKQALELVEDNKQDKDRLDQKYRKLDGELDDYKNKYDKLLRLREDERETLLELEDKLAVKIAEIESLQRKINIFENDIFLYKKEYNKLLNQVQNIKMSTDDEKMLRGDLENRIGSIQDELQYRQQQHDQEIKEILDNLFKDDTAMYRDIFHNELGNALKDIRKEFEEKQPDQDREHYYQTKIQEVIKLTAQKSQAELAARESVKKLSDKEHELAREYTNLQARNDYLVRRIQELERHLEIERNNFQDALNSRDSQLDELRRKMEEILRELEELTDLKLRLDAEIQQYRLLLTGEEERLNASMNEMMQAQEQIAYHRDTERVVKAETALRTSFQKSSRGVISFNEMSPDGQFVILENISRDKDQKLDGWILKRSIDGGLDDIIHTFGMGNTLRSGKTMKVSTKPFRRMSGTSVRVTTVLLSEKGEEAASITMKNSAT